jgi:alkylation response protein AidB-like acyl-CoA dehydrogenase
MPSFRAPLADIRFVLDDLLDVSQIAALPGYEEVTPDVLLAVLEEGAKLCEEVLFPLNQVGDAEGCVLDGGTVRTPTGFKDAWRLFAEGGWIGLGADPAYGGQGLPHVASVVMDELLSASNQSFSMYPGLTSAAYAGIHAWGSEELKQRYLAKMVSGEWAGTMCLTEAHAGTDLGLITTRAVPAGDGAYHVTGTKIFISAGEHDLTDNIVHLVLARLPDAPAGTRGISMFLVPKFIPTEDGRPGTRNGVSCGAIEHKMGIKGSVTCVLNFENAVGWLVGEEHRGMRAMFTLMNAARIGVGMQGLGLAEVSYQNAVAYARDRLQGRALTGATEPALPADPIIVHPDVRRMLMTMRAFVEGARALAYWTGIQLDLSHHHPDAERRQAADDLVAFLTPVVKAFLTDFGFEVTNLGLQVFGGHGYIREFGVEQYVRDARIGQIYEGTNGVQAMDLIGRKLLESRGTLFARFAAEVESTLAAAEGDERVAAMAGALASTFAELESASRLIGQRATADANEAGAAAHDYLHLVGLVALGLMWLRAARVAHAKLDAGEGDRGFLEAKLETARYYFARLLPRASAHLAAIRAGAATVMAVSADRF